MKAFIKLLFLLLVFQSCNPADKRVTQLKNMLKECDEVIIVLDNQDNNSNTTLRIKDTTGINMFTELITGNKEEVNDSCDPLGDLMYKKDGKVLFIAEFSIPNHALKSNCFYVRYNLQQDTFRHKFTYRAGMALSGLKYEEPKLKEDSFLEQ